jgi:hypothetical protein
VCVARDGKVLAIYTCRRDGGGGSRQAGNDQSAAHRFPPVEVLHEGVERPAYAAPDDNPDSAPSPTR